MFAIAAILVLLAAPEPAPPKPASYELHWSAPESCPDAESIRERIAALVPEPEGGEGVMVVEGMIEATREGFALELATEFAGGRSSRRVEARRCADLGESTALVVAIALEPSLTEEDGLVPEASGGDSAARTGAAGGERPGSAAHESGDERRQAETDERDVREPASSSSRAPARWRPRSRSNPTDLFARLTLLLELGSMPRVGGGNALAIGLLWPRFRMELSGMYLWPRRADGPADSVGLYQLGSAGARGCLRVFGGPTEFPLCAGIEAGGLRVDSRDLDPPRSLLAAWLAPLLGVGVALRRGRAGFWSMAELGITAVGTRILVRDEVAFRSLPVSLRFVAGVEIFFAAPGR